MPEEADLIKIDQEGKVVVAEGARQRLLGHRGAYRVVPATPGLMILQRVPETEPPESAAKVVMCGEIDRQGGLVDIIHFVHSNAWTGQLNVVAGSVCKALYFRRGDIHTAASNLADDRLGALLYRYGMVSEEEVAEALQASAFHASKLGHTLVDRGQLSAHELYTYMCKQVEEIFFSVLSLDTGDFYFYRTKDEGLSSQLQLSAKALLFEGVKRIDELSLFRQKLPTSEVILCRREPPPLEKLAELEARVLELVDGVRPLSTIARHSHLGEFETTRVLYRLLQSGWVQLVPPRTTLHQKAAAKSESPIDACRQIIETYNEVYARIHSAVAQKGRHTPLTIGLESFFASSVEFAALYSGVQLDEEGRLPCDLVLDNLEHIPVEDRLDYLHRGLNELLFFELFTAGESVDRREELELHQRLNQILRQLPPTGEALEPDISIEAHTEPQKTA